MSNAKHETIADLVAWLRRPREGENAYLTLWREEIADRIEAACKQSVTNCNRLGNAGRMLDALNEIRSRLSYLYGHIDGTFDPPALKEVYEIAGTALSTPPRNCDRPECATTKKAQKVWRKEDGGKTAYYEWLLATSTAKGGSK